QENRGQKREKAAARAERNVASRPGPRPPYQAANTTAGQKNRKDSSGPTTGRSSNRHRRAPAPAAGTAPERSQARAAAVAGARAKSFVRCTTEGTISVASPVLMPRCFAFGVSGRLSR